MGFGGYVKLTGAFDFNGVVDNYDFITYDIPVGTGDLNDKRLYFDAHQSRFYTEILGSIKGSAMRLYLEIDFYSQQYYPRLRHAYGQYKGFLFGQTWSTFMDLDAMPNSVDFEGPNSAISLRAPMIRYTVKLSHAFNMQAALELPEVSMSYRAPLTSTYQYIPDVILNFKFTKAWGHLQLGGIFRTMTYKDTLQNKIDYVYGYGGAISGLFNIAKMDKFMFQAVLGTGISKYIQDIAGVGMDAATERYKYNPPEMKPLVAGGFYIAYQRFWRKNLNSTLTYGLTWLKDSPALSDDTEYKQGQYVCANLFWNILPNFAVAIEYLWGQRDNYNGNKGNANRVNGMVQFNF